MNKTRFFLMLGLTLGLARYSYAATCDASTNCENPADAGSQGSWNASASGMTGIQSLNSVGPNGNAIGSRYFFAAVTSNLGATTAKGTISTTGDGTQVVGSFALNSSGTPGSTVTGGVVNSLLGNRTYFFYAQACPSGALLDSTHCSVWAQIGSKSTLNYPSSVFSAPVKPTDATLNTIAARTNVPNADLGNISQIQLEVDNLINGGLNQSGILIGWPGVNQSNPINNSLYTVGGGFKPNVKYQYKGQVFYPYGVAVPTGGSETQGPFWTTPALPGTVSAANITHCSAQITALNSTGAPANPSYTTYSLCASGTGGSCGTNQISGGTPNDTAAVTIINLVPGTTYTPTGQALVGNGDGTSAGWDSSGVKNGNTFTTAGFAGTFGSANVTTTSADFTFSGLDLTGVTAYQMIVNGSNFGAQVNSVPVSPIHLTGLAPNTQYNVKIKLIEASCSSIVPTSGVAFTTNADVPTVFTLSATGPHSLSASWTDSTNGAGTTYQVQYCTDAGFTQNCQLATSNTKSATLSTGVNALTTYWAHVLAVAVSGGANSAYSTAASATTPADQSGISISPNSATVATGNTQTFTATVVDQNGVTLTGQAVNWAVSGGGSLSTANGASTIFTGTTVGGPFTLTASLAGYPNATATITVVNSGVTFTVNPTATVFQTSATLTATATSFGGHQISYTWSVVTPAGANVGFNPNGTVSASTSLATLHAAGPYTIQCKATDTTTNMFATANVSFSVTPILNSITVTPNNVTINVVDNQTFTATGLDQFGNAMPLNSVAWSSTGGGVSGSGVFHSPGLGNNIKVTATQNGISGSAFVTVVNYDVGAAKAYPVPFKSTQGSVIHFSGLGSDAKIRIYTTTGRKVFDIEVTNPTGTYDWNVKNNSSENLASGVYLYVIESPTTKKNGKLIIIQ